MPVAPQKQRRVIQPSPTRGSLNRSKIGSTVRGIHIFNRKDKWIVKTIGVKGRTYLFDSKEDATRLANKISQSKHAKIFTHTNLNKEVDDLLKAELKEMAN